MGAGVENLWEDDRLLATRPGGGHFSMELNRRCLFESVCGNNCFLLARRAPESKILTREEVVTIAEEGLACGEELLHFNAAGMEPFDKSPDEPEPVIFALLERWHAMPACRRPTTFNAITSGALLTRYVDRLREVPLSSLIVSVDDAPTSGLRSRNAGGHALAEGLRVREAGGCVRLCVNTVLTDNNEDQVLAIGRVVAEAGADQWMISPLRVSDGTRMEAAVSGDALISFGQRVDRVLRGCRSAVRVILDVPHNTVVRAAGGGARRISEWSGWCWRWPLENLEIELQAFCPQSRFLRVRWDGELLQKDELHAVGLRTSALGRYQPGSIRRVIRSWRKVGKICGCNAAPESLAAEVHGAKF